MQEPPSSPRSPKVPTELDFGPQDIRGLRFFKPVRSLLESLHGLHDHPNRQLHYDEYIALLLLYFLNPIMTSLRALQHGSGFDQVQKTIGVRRASLGSLSEASQVFDPTPLEGLFRHLAEQAQKIPAHLPRPQGVPDDLALVATDGTLLRFVPRMVPWFYRSGPRTGPPPGLKLHLQLDLLRGVPIDASCTGGYASESRALQGRLHPETFYLLDRGFVNFTLYQTIVDAGSSFLARIRDTNVWTAVEERPLSPQAKEQGVSRDAIVTLGSAPHAGKLKQPLRLICARVPLPAPRNLNPQGRKHRNPARDAASMDLILLTDRLDMPAELLVVLFRYRWQIEIFFRWFKCTLRCKHLLAESENGMQLQIYAALIASLLITIWTGRKPTKRTLETIQYFLIGWASEKELLEYIAKLK